ncbi:MAG: DPP IV N-terminal domain-containing protein, partial [Anaerolineales bacterium]
MSRLKRDLESGRAAAPASRPAIAQQPARRLTPSLILGIASLAIVLAVAAYLLTRSRPASAPAQGTFTQLTDDPGPERFASLSPDGRSLAYASFASGNSDIYLLRVGGRNPVNLTQGAAAHDRQPAFSPDGEQIAFRSDRDGGGIFVMGATGESVRRLTDAGHNPAWSPDGKQIVFGTEGIERPEARFTTNSQLWVINLSNGEKRQLTRPDVVPDAVQPHWSPRGHRIAYWAIRGGQRDIWTVGADGSKPTAITQDAALDWSPVWSPDGKFIYFSSDRGGSMNLWRVPIEETSGSVPGPPEPLTTPSPYAGLISISRDGRRIAYTSE